MVTGPTLEVPVTMHLLKSVANLHDFIYAWLAWMLLASYVQLATYLASYGYNYIATRIVLLLHDYEVDLFDQSARHHTLKL